MRVLSENRQENVQERVIIPLVIIACILLCYLPRDFLPDSSLAALMIILIVPWHAIIIIDTNEMVILRVFWFTITSLMTDDSSLNDSSPPFSLLLKMPSSYKYEGWSGDFSLKNKKTPKLFPTQFHKQMIKIWRSYSNFISSFSLQRFIQQKAASSKLKPRQNPSKLPSHTWESSQRFQKGPNKW